MLVKVTKKLDKECDYLTVGKRYRAYDIQKVFEEVYSFNIEDDQGDEIYCWKLNPSAVVEFDVFS